MPSLSATGGTNVFISVFAPDGTFTTVKQLGSGADTFFEADKTYTGNSVTLGGGAQIYAAGLFNGTGDFDPGSDVQTLQSQGISDAFVVELDALGGNLPPVAVNDTFTATENSVNNSLDVLANDSDPESAPLSIAAVGTTSAGGAAAPNGANDAIIYTPPSPVVTGSDTFTYTVSDGTATATAQVTVNINRVPNAVDDTATVTVNSSDNSFDVLANDSDPESAALTIAGVGATSAGGTATTDGSTITYTPATDFTGMETFTYIASDGVLTDTATVTVTVNAEPNNDPVATDDTPTVSANSTDNQLNVLNNDTDPDGDTLTITSVGDPNQGGTATTDGTFITYTPATDFSDASEVFTYTISDGRGGTDTATVTVNVTAMPNQAPDAVDDTASVAPDSSDNTIDVLSNDTDPDGDSLTITAVGATNQGGVATTTGSVVTYSPASGFSGTEIFTYTISDGRSGTDTALVTVNVTADNTPPVAVDDTDTVEAESSNNTIDVLANDSDADGDPLTITAIGAANQGGMAALTDGSSVMYTPALGFSGTEVFTYTVSDGNGGSATAVVEVTVTAIDANADADSDGILNGDEDRNGDGIYGNDDTDNDGTPDYLDPDDDGDGISTADEGSGDDDGDGIPNYLDAVDGTSDGGDIYLPTIFK